MTQTAVYTGTFDPLTLGHLDIIGRALRLCDRLVIGVAASAAKMPLFSAGERLAMMTQETQSLVGTVEVKPFAGLAVDFARAEGARFVVRGLRSGSDFDYEVAMTAMNGCMAPEIETIFLLARPGYAHIASSLVKDVARGGGAVELFVSEGVASAIRNTRL